MTDRTTRIGAASTWDQPALAAPSKAERVADIVEERIRSDGLAVGAFLGTKATLREQLRVSPATLDTALGVLVDRGVVEVQRGVKGGIRVAGVSPALWMGRTRWPIHGGADAGRAGEAMALYLALQPHIVARAVGALTAADRKRLKAAKERLRRSIGDPVEYYEAHIQAHHILLESSHDEVLTAMVRTLIATMEALAGPAQPPSGEDVAAYTAERVEVHVGVIDGVLEGDLDRAWRRLLEHGVTSADVPAALMVLPPGALRVQEQWARGVNGRRGARARR